MKQVEETATVVSTRVETADRDGCRCYGCRGEMPIEKGSKYLAVTLQIEKRFCQRCWCALENKMAFAGDRPKTFDGEGSLMFSKLSSNFKRQWNGMCRALASLPDDVREGKEGERIQKEYLDAMIPPERMKELDELDRAKREEQERKDEAIRAEAERVKSDRKRLARAKRGATAVGKGVMSLCKACIGLKAKLMGMGMGREEVETALADVYAGREEIQRALEKMTDGLKESK